MNSSGNNSPVGTRDGISTPNSSGSPTNVTVAATLRPSQPAGSCKPGTKVAGEDMVKMCVRNKIRVRTTDAYRMRLPKDGDGDLSQGRMGIIMKIDKHPDGFMCDVLWAHGKAFRGYCVGFRGYFDLEIAPPSKSVKVEEQAVAAPKQHMPMITPTGSGSSADTSPSQDSTPDEGKPAGALLPSGVGASDRPAEIGVIVGYLHSAPTVRHEGGKHIWSCDGPMTYK